MERSAADLRSSLATRAMERRAFAFRHETRMDIEDDSAQPKIVGHAAVFDSPSEPMDLYWGETFRELVAPGAFKKTIQESDIRCLFNHNADYVLGRNKAGTLSLREDQQGLYMECDPPDTGYARDLQVCMQRGDIDQMSFGFQVVKERWEEDSDAKTVTRTLLEVRLFDVSVVTYPAYPETDAAVRSALVAAGFDLDQLAAAVTRSRAGQPLSTCDGDLLRCSVDTLRSFIPAEPAAGHSETTDESASRPVHSIAMRRRRLDLLDRSLR